MNNASPTSHRNTRRCWAEIRFQDLRFNLQVIRRRIGSGRKVIAVVKADGYGHGLGPMTRELHRLGIDTFGVATPAEGREALAVAPKARVILLSGSLPDEIPAIVRSGLIPTVSSWREAEAFAFTARRMGKTLPIQLKIDTGMGRLGIWHEAAGMLIERVASLRPLKIGGIYTHLATADSHRGFARIQLKRMEQALELCRKLGVSIPMRHYANSAATLAMPLSGFTHVRPGLCIYGLSPLPGKTLLRPILSLKSHLTVVKDIGRGRPLSYDSLFKASRRIRVGTVAAGYADGFRRELTGKASVLIRGHRCRVLGRITMDEIIVDLSRVPDAAWGDPVTLIGRDGSEQITAQELARQASTIPWDILCGISKRVERIYLK